MKIELDPELELYRVRVQGQDSFFYVASTSVAQAALDAKSATGVRPVHVERLIHVEDIVGLPARLENYNAESSEKPEGTP